MKLLLAASIVGFLVALGATVSTAEEQPLKAPAAEQAAPAANADKAVQTTGGCMPGGGCCGQGACAQAAAATDKGAAGDAAGGCPCMKNKNKKAQ